MKLGSLGKSRLLHQNEELPGEKAEHLNRITWTVEIYSGPTAF